MTEKNIRQIWSDGELDAALADLHSDPGPDDGLAFARASLVAATGTPLDRTPFHQAPPARRKSRGSWRWISVAAAVAAAIGTAVAWWRARTLRLGVLLAGGVAFVPWAIYWGLLTP